MATAHYPCLVPADHHTGFRRPITLTLTGYGHPQKVTLYPYNFEAATICVVDADGQTIMQDSVPKLAAQQHKQVEVPVPGLYFVETSDGFYHEIKECRVAI